MTVAYVLMVFVAIALSRTQTRFVTPMIIFTGLWALMTFFYDIDPYLFDMFSFEIPTSAHLLRLGSISAFLTGAALVWFGVPRRQVAPLEPLRLSSSLTGYLIALFAVGMLYRIWIVLQMYGAFAGALPGVRQDFVSGTLEFPAFINLTTLCANLAALNLGVLFGLGRRRRVSIGLLLLFSIINDATMADKAGLRLVIFFVFAAYYGRTMLLQRPLPGREVIKYGLSALAAFALYSSITYFRIIDQSASIFDVMLPHLYGDVVGNVASSAWFIDHPWPEAGFGAYSFSGFYQYLGVSEIERSAEFFNADTVGVGIFNTTDYLAYIFADFGLGGVLAVSVALGAVSAWLFLRAKYARTIATVQLLAFVTGGLVISLRGFYFGAPGFWLTTLLISGQAALSDRHRWRPRQSSTAKLSVSDSLSKQRLQ